MGDSFNIKPAIEFLKEENRRLDTLLAEEQAASNDLARKTDNLKAKGEKLKAENERLRGVLRELLEACVKDVGDPDEADGDDGAVGWDEDGEMTLTFGMMRRARAALSETGGA